MRKELFECTHYTESGSFHHENCSLKAFFITIQQDEKKGNTSRQDVLLSSRTKNVRPQCCTPTCAQRKMEFPGPTRQSCLSHSTRRQTMHLHGVDHPSVDEDSHHHLFVLLFPRSIDRTLTRKRKRDRDRVKRQIVSEIASSWAAYSMNRGSDASPMLRQPLCHLFSCPWDGPSQ